MTYSQILNTAQSLSEQELSTIQAAIQKRLDAIHLEKTRQERYEQFIDSEYSRCLLSNHTLDCDGLWHVTPYTGDVPAEVEFYEGKLRDVIYLLVTEPWFWGAGIDKNGCGDIRRAKVKFVPRMVDV